MAGGAGTGGDAHQDLRFRDAFRIPLVRAVMPAAVAVAVGLGALFSLGIVFVRDVLDASDAQFGVLIALFGVGAVAGLQLLRSAPDLDDIRATRIGVAALGAIVASFSLAPVIGLAFIGAAAFGAAAAWTLASGMGALQSRLDGNERVLAFSAFHVVIRCGLAVAAIGAGAAGELVDGVRWPVVGTLAPARLVLFWAGILVLLERDAGSGAGGGHGVTVAIVTDSAAALPAEVVDALGVTVVPMWLQLDGTARHEDEVDLDELIVHRHVSTSGPTPGEFEAVLRDRSTDDGVCLLTISATMSSTYEAAVLGAELVGRAHGADRVARRGYADRGRCTGARRDRGRARRRRVGPRSTRWKPSPAPRWTRCASSRASPTSATSCAAAVCRTSPGGPAAGSGSPRCSSSATPVPTRSARRGGMDNTLERMVARCRRAHADGHRLQVAVLHAHALEVATDLLNRVAKELDPSETFVASFGAVMVAHTGPGLVGLAWRWEPVAVDDGAEPSAR